MGGRDASQKAKEIISEASKRVITLLTDEDFVSKKYATRFQEQGRKSLLPGQPRQRTTASFQETPCYGPTTIAKDAEKYLRPIFEAVRNKMPGCTFFTRLPHKSLYTRAGVNPGGSLTSQFPAEPRTHGIITADAYDIKVLARMVVHGCKPLVGKKNVLVRIEPSLSPIRNYLFQLMPFFVNFKAWF